MSQRRFEKHLFFCKLHFWMKDYRHKRWVFFFSDFVILGFFYTSESETYQHCFFERISRLWNFQCGLKPILYCSHQLLCGKHKSEVLWLCHIVGYSVNANSVRKLPECDCLQYFLCLLK